MFWRGKWWQDSWLFSGSAGEAGVWQGRAHQLRGVSWILEAFWPRGTSPQEEKELQWVRNAVTWPLMPATTLGFPGPVGAGQAEGGCAEGGSAVQARPALPVGSQSPATPGEGCGESGAHPAESDRDD